MNESCSRLLEPISQFESAEASLFFGQLEDLSHRLWACAEGISAEELGWQLTPGTNTIGMLLAHIAITEVFWTSVLLERAFLCQQVLGIGSDDDGLPLPEGEPPPSGLAGKGPAFYRDLHLRAREHTRSAVAPLADSDLLREIEHRSREDRVTLNGRWILYHMVEHHARHNGQIGLLRHLYRLRPRG